MSRRRGPSYIEAWTPQLRLYSDDEEVFIEEPFATLFAEQKNKTGTRQRNNALWQALIPTLEEECFVCLVNVI
jgi:hypothetical protein